MHTVMHSTKRNRRGVLEEKKGKEKECVFREHVPRVCLDFIITVAVDDDDQHRLAIQSTIYRSCICPDPRSNNISFSPLLMAPCVRESHSRPFTCLLISPDRRVSKIDILQSLRPVPWLGRNKFDAPLPLIRKVEPPLKQRANDSRGCKFLEKIIRLEHVFFNRASPSF